MRRSKALNPSAWKETRKLNKGTISSNNMLLLTKVNITVSDAWKYNTAPPSKNTVYASQISCKLLSFYLERFLKKLADDQCSSITKGSIYHIKHNVHTTFSYSSGLTRNWVINGSIYYILYLQILCFYLGWKNMGR